MNRLKRIKTILCTLYRYRLAELIASLVRPGWARTFLNMLPQSPKFKHETPAVRLRLAFGKPGADFHQIRTGIVHAPRLIPHDYAVELARLQDKVPPFDAQLSRSQIEKSLGQSIDTLYAEFETEPVASASIAQVHKARLHSGEQIAVKVLRPNLLPVIEQDLSLMRFGAGWVERLFSDGKRLKPREVVAEFDKYLHDELDLMREAANASQLGRNFQNSDMLIVPKVFYDYCTSDVLTIEWMDGTPVSDIAKLKADGIDLHKLADYGVEIFFTQVFRDGFFPCGYAPRQYSGRRRQPLYRPRFRHRRHADRLRQALSCHQLPCLLQPRLPPRRYRPHRIGLGACRHACGRVGSGCPRRVRACVQQTDFANFLRLGADAPV